jgi:transposase InsO family protein
MPWKESDTVSERLKFITRLREGERMTDLCREFGISRKTGYKLVERYGSDGAQGLFDRSRRPRTSPQRTPDGVVEQVVRMRQRYPTWGPKKLRYVLQERQPEVRWPAASTIGVILKDAGLVDGRKRRRRAWPTPPSERCLSQAPNELWCFDFKGQFRLGDRRVCYPLTVSDHFSRYLLGCEALDSTRAVPTANALECVFREHGLPARMRSDNGSPFASTGLAGLTKLAVWLLRLEIELERIEPGHPEQNGRHERMHLTLKQETIRPAAHSMLQQQERFDDFRNRFNDERPHEALAMKTPKSVHRCSLRPLPGQLPPLSYPNHDLTKTVSQGGAIRLQGQDLYLCRALAGQDVGLTQLDTQTWLVSFMQLDLAYLDTQQRAAVPITPNPAAPRKVSPMSPV